MPDTPAGQSAEPDGSHSTEFVLAELDSLPTLSTVAIRVLQITADRESAAADVVKVLQGDQSLTARVLSIAGSSWAGARAPVTSLEKAVPLLGYSAIRSIVLSVSVFDCFPPPSTPSGGDAFARTEFWKHSVAVACAARRIAAGTKALKVEAETAFVAGLLHDIGKVALSALFPKAYDRIVQSADEAHGDIADTEREILAADHTVVGRRLAERWRLPQELQEAIWLHHLASEAVPTAVSAPNLIQVVRLADTLAREQRIGYSGNHTFYEHAATLAERMGIARADFDEAAQTLVADVTQYAEMLGLDREAPESMYVQSIARANAELGRLNTELTRQNQRLASRSRYFDAMGKLDRHLEATSTPTAVVEAATYAAAIALETSQVTVFGVRERLNAADLGWLCEDAGQSGSVTLPIDAELRAWLEAPEDSVSAVATRAPAAVRALLDQATHGLGRAANWMVPIVRGERIIGGIVYASEDDERARLHAEANDLRCFLASVGLALSRAHAQAAAQQLSEELAEMNRRLHQAQAKLLESKTISKIAEMAAGAGHELNSPLTVISGRAQMLATTVDDPEAKRTLELIYAKAHECSQIVTALMDFARPRKPEFADVDLAELLADVRQRATERLELGEDVLRLELPMSEPRRQELRLRADRGQLATLFDELIANAALAIHERGGTISLGVRDAGGGVVEVSVRDTGPGMRPEVLDRAFDPFYSHREAGRGRGLGLPRAFRIVESHGGRIWLESSPGKGTTAHVRLPRAPATQASSAAKQP